MGRGSHEYVPPEVQNILHIDMRRGTFLVDVAPVGRLSWNITKGHTKQSPHGG